MNQIREARRRAGLSQTELAERAGISQQAVAGWETGATDPRWELAPRLATILSCTIDELYGRQPPEQDDA